MSPNTALTVFSREVEIDNFKLKTPKGVGNSGSRFLVFSNQQPSMQRLGSWCLLQNIDSFILSCILFWKPVYFIAVVASRWTCNPSLPSHCTHSSPQHRLWATTAFNPSFPPPRGAGSPRRGNRINRSKVRESKQSAGYKKRRVRSHPSIPSDNYYFMTHFKSCKHPSIAIIPPLVDPRYSAELHPYHAYQPTPHFFLYI